MTSQQTLIETINLENSLELRLYDASRKIAGDRWLLTLTALVDVPMEMADQHQAGADIDQLKAVLGEMVPFEKKMERNFVGDDSKDAILKEIRDSFVANIVPYLSHPDFPAKLIAKQFKEQSEKSNWYPR